MEIEKPQFPPSTLMHMGKEYQLLGQSFPPNEPTDKRYNYSLPVAEQGFSTSFLNLTEQNVRDMVEMNRLEDQHRDIISKG